MRSGSIDVANIRRRRPGVMLAILALLLASCEPGPLHRPQAETGPAASRAERFSADGQHGAAAAIYRDLADQGLAPADRQHFLILAAREYRLSGEFDTARRLLDGLAQPVAAENRLLWATVGAELALSRGDPDQALAYLAKAPQPGDRSSTADLLLIRGEALFRLNRPADAVSALLEREKRLSGAARIADNHRIIWQGLQDWGSRITPQSWRDAENPVLSGWLQLAYLTLPLRTDPTALRFVLTNWKMSHPDHPASTTLVDELLAKAAVMLNYPHRVALLLPLSGRQKQTAAAIRDGFLAAHFAVDYLPVRPDIYLYDVSRLGAAQAYQQAVMDGADFIVGPLLKDAALEAARVAGHTPTLALNFLPEGVTAPTHFYQFSLSPEDEARQAARRALEKGRFRAVVLAPGNEWGQRLLTSFATQLEGGGGKLLGYRYYDPRTPDYPASIRALLLINESQARYQRLSRNLGQKLTFEPRLRQDVDLIFLAVRAQAGKAIRPQLRFYFAGDIPTYATSAIFREDSRNNSDLNGILFPEIPWIIEPDAQTAQIKSTIARYWPSQARHRARFYAMGYDAYRLMPLLHGSVRFGSREVPGLTGQLSLDARGRIHRRMPWARMTGGQPVPVDETGFECRTPSSGGEGSRAHRALLSRKPGADNRCRQLPLPAG